MPARLGPAISKTTEYSRGIKGLRNCWGHSVSKIGFDSMTPGRPDWCAQLIDHQNITMTPIEDRASAVS
jgi:hypothetical protein